MGDRFVSGYRFRHHTLPLVAKRKMRAESDISGNRYGRLVADLDLGPAGRGVRWWGCSCDCGGKVAVASRSLIEEKTKSCGCLHREKIKAGLSRLPAGEASKRDLLARYKRSANKRGYEWSISDDDFFSLATSDCSYCGSKPEATNHPKKGKTNGAFVYSGVDRIDSSVGYTKSNCVSCCTSCNLAKGTMSVEKFIGWLLRIANHINGQSK